METQTIPRRNRLTNGTGSDKATSSKSISKGGQKEGISNQSLEEYSPEIVYIKGIHNTVADAISRLEYDPAANPDRLSYHMSRVQTRVENDTGIRQEQFKWKAVTNRLVNYHKNN